jgi:hypothetical protein
MRNSYNRASLRRYPRRHAGALGHERIFVDESSTRYLEDLVKAVGFVDLVFVAVSTLIQVDQTNS